MRNVAAALAAFSVTFGSALAEDKTARVLEEIVVTAQRTEENVRDGGIS